MGDAPWEDSPCDGACGDWIPAFPGMTICDLQGPPDGADGRRYN